MIGYNRLGINGRFGNQLFQYASLRGIAAKHGYDFCIPPDGTRTANYGMHDPFKLHHLKHIDEVPYKTRWESHFHFDEDLFNNCEDNRVKPIIASSLVPYKSPMKPPTN